MVKSVASNVRWAARRATWRRAQIWKAESSQVWAMRVIVKVVPLKSGPRSLASCKAWHGTCRWYVDSIASRGVTILMKSKRWRAKVRIHKDSQWTNGRYDPSLPLHFPDFFEEATRGHNARDCHDLPCFVAYDIQYSCRTCEHVRFVHWSQIREKQ